MNKLKRWALESQRSPLKRWILNSVLWRKIPFNRPHKLTLDHCTEKEVGIRIPFIKKNKNHLNGLHACVMLTAAEYASGMMLMLKSNQEFRIIMKDISASYHYQGKMEARAQFSLTDQEFENQVVRPLQKNDKIDFQANVLIHDVKQNKLCDVRVVWQLKKWNKVKTSL